MAQIGEVAPPQKLIEGLRREHDLFVRVEGIPGTTNVYAGHNECSDQMRQRIKTETMRMRQLAGDLGADYIFLYGGTVDYDSRENGLQVLDLTIVGAFVVPSRHVKGSAKASGALLDVRSGRVVMMVVADAQKDDLATSAGHDAAEKYLLENLRDRVIDKLGTSFVQQCRQMRATALSAMTRPSEAEASAPAPMQGGR